MYLCNFRCLNLALESAPSNNHGSCRSDKPMNPKKALPSPIHVSTNRNLVNPEALRALFSRCNLSCHRFPFRDSSTGRVEPPDPRKLRLALQHSSIVVSVFCGQETLNLASSDDSASDDTPSPRAENWGAFLFGKLMPPPPQVNMISDGRLVGFGRAVSDHGFTASIYDVLVPAKSTSLHFDFDVKYRTSLCVPSKWAMIFILQSMPTKSCISGCPSITQEGNWPPNSYKNIKNAQM